MPKDLTISLRIQRSLSGIWKTSNRNVWSNVFWYVKVCIFLKFIQYTINWDNTNLEKLSDKINATKNALFLLSQAPTHHSFTFSFWLFHGVKQNVCLYKNMGGICHFRFRFNFIKVYSFVQQNAWALWRHNFFQNENHRKSMQSFAPRPLIF